MLVGHTSFKLTLCKILQQVNNVVWDDDVKDMTVNHFIKEVARRHLISESSRIVVCSCSQFNIKFILIL